MVLVPYLLVEIDPRNSPKCPSGARTAVPKLSTAGWAKRTDPWFVQQRSKAQGLHIFNVADVATEQEEARWSKSQLEIVRYAW